MDNDNQWYTWLDYDSVSAWCAQTSHVWLIPYRTFMYTLGDLETVLATPTGFPFIQVFHNATGSKGGATAMTLILTLSAAANAMTNMATASCQLWAFARDGGVPFHGWFSKVNPRMEIPLNAILFTTGFTAVLSLIDIGSTVAYNQTNSLRGWCLTRLVSTLNRMFDQA